jgi:hypothetical protein
MEGIAGSQDPNLTLGRTSRQQGPWRKTCWLYLRLAVWLWASSWALWASVPSSITGGIHRIYPMMLLRGQTFRTSQGGQHTVALNKGQVWSICDLGSHSLSHFTGLFSKVPPTANPTSQCVCSERLFAMIWPMHKVECGTTQSHMLQAEWHEGGAGEAFLL